MSIAKKVRIKISRMTPGTVFLVNELYFYKKAKNATLKAIANYIKNDELKRQFGYLYRLAKGLYYKEEKGILGKLPPSYHAILSALLISKKQQVGFIAGHVLFNQKGLSTQVPTVTTIITSKKTPSFINLRGIKIEVIKQKKIKKENIKINEFAYILNNIEKIQDIENEIIMHSIKEYIHLISSDYKNFDLLYKKLNYKKTKALLGALMEEYLKTYDVDIEHLISRVRNDLNQKSKYHFNNISNYITYRKNWNIVF